MWAGGEPVLGGALLLVFFSFFFLSLLFVFFIVFIVLVISAVASPPGGHDSETTTAVDEVQKTRLTKEGRRRQTGYPHTSLTLLAIGLTAQAFAWLIRENVAHLS